MRHIYRHSQNNLQYTTAIVLDSCLTMSYQNTVQLVLYNKISVCSPFTETFLCYNCLQIKRRTYKIKGTIRLRRRPAFALLIFTSLFSPRSALLYNIASKSCSSESKVIVLSRPFLSNKQKCIDNVLNGV